MPEMLSPEAYVTQVLAGISTLPAVGTPLSRAHGLVLAEDVAAALPVPPWTNSAMDGYAVRAEDVAGAAPGSPVVLPVTGDVPAGAAPEPLSPGTAQRIMTGAMLPEGADAVVRVEDTDQEPGPHPLPERVAIRAAARPGTNVRRAGEDVGVGDPVLAAGTLLSATALSSLASVGLGRVRAVPRPRVAVVSTGAELVDPGLEPPAGAIPDSNALLLAGLIAEHGAELASVARSGDTADSLAHTLAEAARGADLVVTSGGVSAGAFDPLTMLDAAGQGTGGAGDDGGASGGTVRLRFAKVAMQPGKPQAHGTVRAEDGRLVPVVALPGNPVSVLVSFTTVVVPVLARLAGLDPAPTTVPARARAATSWRTPGGRRQYIPVRFTAGPTEPGPEGIRDAGPTGTVGTVDSMGSTSSTGALPRTGPVGRTPWVEPTHRLGSGSHLVASLPAAQALAVVEAGVPRIGVGDVVGLLPLAGPAVPGGRAHHDAPATDAR